MPDSRHGNGDEQQPLDTLSRAQSDALVLFGLVSSLLCDEDVQRVREVLDETKRLG